MFTSWLEGEGNYVLLQSLLSLFFQSLTLHSSPISDVVRFQWFLDRK